MERWKDGKMERWKDGEMGLRKIVESVPIANLKTATKHKISQKI